LGEQLIRDHGASREVVDLADLADVERVSAAVMTEVAGWEAVPRGLQIARAIVIEQPDPRSYSKQRSTLAADSTNAERRVKARETPRGRESHRAHHVHAQRRSSNRPRAANKASRLALEQVRSEASRPHTGPV